ncbi:MAG: hypothetical protein J6A75_01085 [Lachnospiraceae bacterium]|nr:hypothetical protein [Lachnospiraceae bacterium]
MRKVQKICLQFLCVVILTVFLLPLSVQAEEESAVSADFSIETTDGNNYITGIFSGENYTSSKSFLYSYEVKTGTEDLKMTVGSSNPSVVKVRAEYAERTFYANSRSSGTNSIYLEIKGVGISTITLSLAGIEKSIDVYIAPEQVDVTNVVQSGYNSVTVSWEKVSGCSGYIIEKSPAEKNQYVAVGTIVGGDTSSAQIMTSWNEEYKYRVIGYVEKEGNRVLGKEWGITKKCIVIENGAEIASVKKSGASSLKIQWSSIEGASEYEVYRSSSENGKYSKVYTVSDVNTTTYTQKVSKGQTYYYYVITKYPEGYQYTSKSLSGFIPKKSKAAVISQKTAMQGVTYAGQYGDYVGNWANPDTTYYYIADGKLNVVSVDGSALKIYTLKGNKLKHTTTKTVNIGSYEKWGGFYHGTDGNFYVAVGYDNLSEKDNKTVIKVYQYNKKWKLKKTCKIKGKATNAFKGIYETFRAGNCRMDMQGNTLYLVTARTMYVGGDGLHHQSNIAFKINTKIMKYKDSEGGYTSHSFNQFAKFKDGNLYQVDHGDAYPRAVNLTIINSYGTDDQEVTEKSVFKIKGNIGDNATGLTIGGMEVGASNVMICGTSQPHYSKVKGVKGWDSSWKKNVYLVVADRETGKSSIKWLTKNNPKKTTIIVGETRMVKLSDEHFAILYNTTNAGVAKLNYVVVNNKGKKVYSKTYANMSCVGASQPILYKGNIVWAETRWGENATTTYRIPAIY